MAAASFRSFDGESEEWELYCEQLEQFFVSNKIDESMKKSELINHLGARTYKLLRDLCTPHQPKDKSYKELCAALSLHFTPPVIVHKERRTFFRAQRGENGPETVNDWIVRIKNLAANCKFGDKLPDHLVNKFVDGLSGKAFDRICEETEALTLEKAQEIALKYETDATSSSAINFVKGRNQRVEPKQKGKPVQWRNSSNGKRPNGSTSKCFGCRREDHLYRDCPFKDYVCRKCKEKGHLQVACGLQKAHYVAESSGQQNDEGLEGEEPIVVQQHYISKCEELFVNKVATKLDSDGFMLEVKIADQVFTMELDSGAGVSVISEKLYRDALGCFPLESSALKLKLFSGASLKVLGVIQPVVEYNSNRKKVLIAVVAEGGPPLLGKNFMKAFGIQLALINSVDKSSVLEELLVKYKELFNGELGCYKYDKVKLEVEEWAKPIYKKPRPVPFKFHNQMGTELDKMEQAGIVTKCDSSPWGTPLVPVLKPDGSLRLCGDYKVTVNRFVKDVKHPLPTAEEIFAKLNGGQKFSKLDLSKAYNQFELTEESKEMCAISTIKGVYRMNRLPFGVKPASGIVQRVLEMLLCGIPGVQNFLDDVVVTGGSDQEHFERLEQVFAVLEKAGLKLNKAKCQFFKSEITFLGYAINKDGLKKTDERIRSIRDAPEPTNVTEVRAFAGLVNYYARFVEGLANLMSPIYQLLKKGAKFIWSKACSEAFQKIKDEICRDVTLTHFDPNADLILTCDASNVGVSAVLSQKCKDGVERPVAFASRILHTAEKNYSVIDKEALAIMYGVNKYFLYLVGNRFAIRTDHKPLLSLFHPQKGIPTIAASRMQRWAHFLSSFSYSIGHVRSQSNIADFSSRFPTESWKLWKEEDSYLNFINKEECGLLSVADLEKSTLEDPDLSQVVGFLTGTVDQTSFERNPYWKMIEELSLEAGVVMRGHRVVVPKSLRETVLEQLHRSHLGMVKSKSIARANVWWPKIDEDIERVVKHCSACVLHSQSPPKAALIPWSPPKGVWSRVHVDFAGPVQGLSYLIVVDALSKWVEVFPTKSCTADFVLDKLVECISRFGLFDELVSDNGTQFTADLVQRFLVANGIKQILTSPGHPASNGEAENMVKTFKSALLKCLSEGSRDVRLVVANFLIGYRKSIHCTTQLSPAMVMLGRDIRTTLDLFKPCRSPASKESVTTVKRNIAANQAKQVANYRGSRDDSFRIGEHVIVRDYRDPNKLAWTPAVVREVIGKRNYRVELTVSGRLIKRHLNQMKSDTRNLQRIPGSSSGEPAVKPAQKQGKSSKGLSRAPVKRLQAREQIPTAAESSNLLTEHRSQATSDTEDSDDEFQDVPAAESTAGGNDIVLPEVVDELSDSLSQISLGPEKIIEHQEQEPPEVGPTSNEDRFDSSAESIEGSEVAGFARGFWRIRDLKGRIFRG